MEQPPVRPWRLYGGLYPGLERQPRTAHWFRENTPVNAEDFQAYTHQSGLQGWAIRAAVNRRVSVLVQPSGLRRGRPALYTAKLHRCSTQPSCCWRWLPGEQAGPAGCSWSGCCAVAVCPLAPAGYERPVLVPVDLAAAGAGGAAGSAALHPRAQRPHARRVLWPLVAAGGTGALHVRV